MEKQDSSAMKNEKIKTCNLRKLRALIVEDSEDDVLFVIRRLRKGGYDPIYERVQTASAMKISLKERQWDIVLCDFNMPKFSASAAIILLKKLKIDIPIIIISGTADAEKAMECMRLGAHDYILQSNLSPLCPAIARELQKVKARNRQKRAERKYHREQQFFRTLTKQSSDIIVLLDSEGTILYENPVVEKKLGYMPKERIGKKVFENIHPDDLKEVADKFKELFRDKNFNIDQKKEIRLRHKNGNWRTFEIAGNRLIKKNVIESVIINLRDITERKMAEDALRSSEEKFLKAFRYNPSAMCISTVGEGRYIDVNNAYLDTFGYQREEIIGRTSSDINLWVDMAERDALVQEIRQAGKVINGELRTRDKYGNIHWLLTSASLIIAAGESYLLTQSMDMTDRKLAEETLKAANKQLQDIIDFLPDATLIVDKDNKIIAWNRAIEEMTGILKTSIIGRGHYQASIPFYGEVRPFLMDLVGMNDTDLAAKYSNVRRIGSVVHAEVFTPALYHNRGAYVFAVASPLLDDAGNTVGRIESIRDITERRRMEDHLRQSEERYRTILDEMEEGYQETDLNGNYTFFNDAFLQIVGYTKEEMMGMNFSRLSADDEETRKVIQAYKDVRYGSAINRNLKWDIIRKDGSRRTCEFFPSLRKDANGLIIGFRGIGRDITESRRAAEMLRKSEKLYTTLVNAIPDVIIHSDLEGNILFVNDKALQKGGYSREEMVGRPLHSFVAPAYRKEALWNKQLMLDNKAGHREYNLLAKDGRKIPFDVNGDVLRDDKGMPVGFVNVCRDISERRRTEKLLKERDDRLRGITENLPGVVYQFYARGNGEYGVSYISEPLDEFSKMVIGDTPPNLDIFFESFVSRVCEEDRERLLFSIKTAVDTVTSWNFEGRIAASSGESIWFQGLSVPKRLDHGIIFNGILLNINERKMAEEKSRQFEEKFHKIFMTTPNAVSLTRLRDGLLIDVNKSFADIIGSKRESVLGKKITEPPINFWVNPSERELMVAELKSGKDVVHGELKFRRDDGTERFGVYSSRIIKIDGDECLIFILQDVTERKLAEEKFRKIFMTTPDCIAISRLENGTIIDVNKGFENIIGWERNEVIGKESNKRPFNFWVDQSERDLMVEELKSGRDIQHCELKFKRKDDSVRDGVYSARTIHIDGDECLIFILQDVTERKLAEEKFRKIFMTSPDCIAITRLKDGLIIDGNQGFEEIVGWELKEVIGTKSTEWPMNFWVDLSVRNFMEAEVRAGRDVLHQEFEFRRKDGSVRQGIFSARPIKIDDEESLIFIVQDVTDSKLAEEKFRQVFMTTPDCIAITRLRDGTVLDINEAGAAMVGWKREEVIGSKSTEPPYYFWVDESARDFMVTELKAGRDVMYHEFEFRHGDGSIRTGIYSARTIDIDGDACIIFIMQDVTRQKRMERDLAESNKMKLISQISSGVAHEVRNPLHAIQAISEAMAIDMDKNSIYEDYLMHIKAQVQRLSHLMKDLLELGKPIHSSQFCVASLTDIASASLEYWSEAYPHLSRKITVLDHLQTGNTVLADANKIQQVIINLMDNAVKHSSQDEEVVLEFDKTSDNCLMLMVIDQGTGIKSQDLPKVFEPFFTTSKGGTGLGLSICKHIVESHGGSIGIVNNKNMQGCTAWFTLPVHDEGEQK